MFFYSVIMLLCINLELCGSELGGRQFVMQQQYGDGRNTQEEDRNAIRQVFEMFSKSL
jgi:hypothetical protein